MLNYTSPQNLTCGLTGKILSTSLLYLGRNAAQHQQQPNKVEGKKEIGKYAN